MEDMRIFLVVSLLLLTLWLCKTQVTDTLQRSPCEAAWLSQALVSVLLSPLSLFSLLSSTLLRLLLSLPSLLLRCLHTSVLLLLAAPCGLLAAGAPLLLSGLTVAVYLLHLALVVAAIAALPLARHKTAEGDEGRARLRKFGGK